MSEFSVFAPVYLLFCSAVNYAMLSATELLDVALLSMAGARSLFQGGWDRAIIKDFPRARMLRLLFDSILLFKR
jgi:hypothetical protein